MHDTVAVESREKTESIIITITTYVDFRTIYSSLSDVVVYIFRFLRRRPPVVLSVAAPECWLGEQPDTDAMIVLTKTSLWTPTQP